jgi:hypothetical protein
MNRGFQMVKGLSRVLLQPVEIRQMIWGIVTFFAKDLCSLLIVPTIAQLNVLLTITKMFYPNMIFSIYSLCLFTTALDLPKPRDPLPFYTFMGGLKTSTGAKDAYTYRVRTAKASRTCVFSTVLPLSAPAVSSTSPAPLTNYERSPISV